MTYTCSIVGCSQDAVKVSPVGDGRDNIALCQGHIQRLRQSRPQQDEARVSPEEEPCAYCSSPRSELHIGSGRSQEDRHVCPDCFIKMMDLVLGDRLPVDVDEEALR